MRTLFPYTTLFRSPEGRSYFLRVSKQTTNLASVSSSQVKAIQVPCPSILEQESAIEVAAAHDECLRREGRELAKLRALKRGLIDGLLSGELVA
jgi:type I restriction enzyme S subunit